MSQAHKGSKLINTGQMKRIGEDTSFLAHYDITEKEVLSGIHAMDDSVFTLRQYEGKFGGGVAVEEGTTNLVRDGEMVNLSHSYTPGWDIELNGTTQLNDWYCYSDWDASANVGYHAHVNTDKFDFPVLELSDLNGAYGLKHRWMAATQQFTTNIYDIGWADGTKVTVSMDVMVSNTDKGIAFGLYHQNENNEADFFGCLSPAKLCELPNRWERISQTFTIDINNGSWNPSSWCFLYIYGHYYRNDAEGTAWVRNVQVERKGFPTSFTPSIRASGKLQYPADCVNPLQGTLNFWYKSSADLPTGITDSKKLFEFGIVNGICSFMILQLPTLVRVMIRGDSMVVPLQFFTSDPMKEWTMITLTWSNGIFQLFKNGILMASTNTLENGFNGPIAGNVISVGGDGTSIAYKPCNGIIDEVRIDKSVRSQEEVLSWYLGGVPFFPKGVYKITY
ncbi:LamG-like jellyroll fold domain-containing protein [Paenibacillus xylanexedens]|uniref:LamG-like jellyroll fold domain-containing protein n=1 Tax=Paenibacillus xylanexedens TaxID=528191 RepID=UPI000F546C16|nr:LamG-like jellyroll fold domain-containing protein [Paenibacillus xylanexedens]RPK20056.1 hypothetical protein EDO6_06573 [Paenibacillus xylanexedens]